MKNYTFKGWAAFAVILGSALLAGCSSLQPVREHAASNAKPAAQGVPNATYNPETRNWDLPSPWGPEQ